MINQEKKAMYGVELASKGKRIINYKEWRNYERRSILGLETFKTSSETFKPLQKHSELFKNIQNLFRNIQNASETFKTSSKTFKTAQKHSKHH